jgi:subtilase family serine protease
VALDADPSTGVAVYVTLPTNRGGSQGTWMTVGGTSLGAPAWAAIIAIADQGRAVAGLGSLDGPTQTLPTLYQLPANDFHAVAATSSVYGGGFGGFRFGARGWSSWFYGSLSSQQSTTTSGANTETGLGSPNGAALIDDLAASTVTVPVTTVPGSGSGGRSGGTTPTPTPPTNPGSGYHRHHSQNGTTTTGQTHRTGSRTVRKTPNQSSSSRLTTVRHRSLV